MAKDLKNILLSTIEENKIKEKTPDKLPLNPTAEGWSGQEVRRFLAKSLIDSEGSFLAEFKKKMIEIKAQFEDVFGDGNGNIQGQIDNIVQTIGFIESAGSSFAEKQDKLVAGENITIDPDTNEISASGGLETVAWQDVENKPELYKKTEIDTMIGNIDAILDSILGV